MKKCPYVERGSIEEYKKAYIVQSVCVFFCFYYLLGEKLANTTSHDVIQGCISSYFMFESVFFDVPRYLSRINTLHK